MSSMQDTPCSSMQARRSCRVWGAVRCCDTHGGRVWLGEALRRRGSAVGVLFAISGEWYRLLEGEWPSRRRPAAGSPRSRHPALGERRPALGERMPGA